MNNANIFRVLRVPPTPLTLSTAGGGGGQIPALANAPLHSSTPHPNNGAMFLVIPEQTDVYYLPINGTAMSEFFFAALLSLPMGLDEVFWTFCIRLRATLPACSATTSLCVMPSAGCPLVGACGSPTALSVQPTRANGASLNSSPSCLYSHLTAIERKVS